MLLLCAGALRSQTLQVSAASSLVDVLPVVGANFEKSHPNAHIEFTFAAAGTLAHQVERGAPVDVFISAANTYMNGLVRKGYIDSTTRRNICGNELVLIAPTGSRLEDWRSLMTSAVTRIAVCNPSTVSCGMYTKQTLTSLGMWRKVYHKFVFAETVRQALGFVEGRDLEAGIVYRTDAMAAKHVMIIDSAAIDTHEPIVFPAAMVWRSKQHVLAKEFLDYLASTEAQHEFEIRGFTSPH